MCRSPFCMWLKIKSFHQGKNKEDLTLLVTNQLKKKETNKQTKKQNKTKQTNKQKNKNKNKTKNKTKQNKKVW